jgi:Cu+-exporting ATPase
MVEAVMRDPVCGMQVDENAPFRSEYRNQTYFFCTEGCKREFDAEPERYSGGWESRTWEGRPA